MSLRFASWASLALCGALLPAPAAAQEATAPTDLEAARQEAEAAAAALDAANEEAAALQEAEQAISRSLATLGKRIVAREQALSDARDDLDRLQGEARQARVVVATTLKELRALLTAMQRAAREPTPSILAHPDRPVAAARSALIMRRLSEALDRKTQAARAALDALAAAEAEAADLERQAASDLEALREDERRLRRFLTEKRDALAAAEEAIAVAEAEAVRLRRAARDLRSFAEALAAAPRPRLRPGVGAGRESSEYRLPDADVAVATPRRRQERRFAQARGDVLRPVAGSLVSSSERFGDDDTPGVFFMTRPYARVISPWDGTVRYAGDFPAYGKIVILEPQDGYQIVITGLSKLDRRTGERVFAGEPLGRMGGPPPTSSEFLFEVSAETRSAREKLYFEIRRNGRPIDPRPWLTTGTG